MACRIPLMLLLAASLLSAQEPFPRPLPLSRPRPSGRLTIAAVGDVLLHSRLQSQAYSEPESVGYSSLWEELLPVLRGADLAFANLEGPVARGVGKDGDPCGDPGRGVDGWVYDTYPLINYHPFILRGLASSGFDVLSTANNHALDRGPQGVVRTLEAIEAAGIGAAGTRPDSSGQCATLTRVDGFTIAWVACTSHTNDLRDRAAQVQYCYGDREGLLDLVDELSADPEIDAVLVSAHWGHQFEDTPEPRQRRLARELVEAGAIAVLGHHPHVLQPCEKLANSEGAEAIVAYSLGNFVSGQTGLANRTTALLWLELEKRETGKARIAAAGYVPLLMKNRRAPYGLVPLDEDSKDPEAPEALDLVAEMFEACERLDWR